jgi:hypothetical protein
MITLILNSGYTKRIAMLLAISILFMSFKSQGNGEVVLNAGTNIVIETVSVLRSDQVMAGQIVDLRVKYDVKVGEKTVIAAGTIAQGQIMRSQKAKGLGKPGFLELQLKSVKAVDGQDVFLTSSNLYQEGEERQTLAIVLGVFICILFLTMKGKNAEILPGFQINAGVGSTLTIKG